MNKIYEDITIVTVLYDSSELINDLLKNLINFKVIIVDNGNNEQILKNLLEFKNIKVISQKKNLGYGKAINFAFKYVKSKYFFVSSQIPVCLNFVKYFQLKCEFSKGPNNRVTCPSFPEIHYDKQASDQHEHNCAIIVQNIQEHHDGNYCSK